MPKIKLINRIPVNFISLCFRLNSKSSSNVSSEMKRPKYKHPFSDRSIESKSNLNFVIPFTTSKDFESSRIAESLRLELLEKFKSKILILVRF